MTVVRRLLALFFDRMRERARARPQRLRILERHALGPRQSLILVEADGRSLLIASSPDAQPAFFPLDTPANPDMETSRLGYANSAASFPAERLPETSRSIRSSRRVS